MANTTYNIDVKVQSKSLGDLENELQQINEELKQVEIGSDAFKELSQQAQKATKELKIAEDAVEGFTDEKKFMAADGAIKLLGGSLAGVVGVLGTLGIESEVFGEFEKKAASAIAVAVGLKDISEGFKQIKDSTVLATTATKIFGKVSKTALIATGIGAFVVALGTVVAYWDEIVGFFDSGKKSASELNTELQDQYDIVDGTYGVLESQKALLEGRGESTLAVNRALLQELEIQIGITEQMILQKQLQLEEEKADNKKVSFWESMKVGALGYFKLYKAQGQAIVEATDENDENTKQTQTELFELQKNLNGLKLKQIGLEGEVATQVEMASGPVEKLEVAQRGIVDATAKYGDTLAINAPKIDENVAAQLKTIAANNENAATIKRNNELEYARGEALFASGQALGALGSILDEESAAAKALAIGSAIINTYLGVTEVLKQKSVLPSPFDVITKVANVATILASGFKAVQAIKSTPTKGGGGMQRQAPSVAGPRGASLPNQQPQIPQTLNTTPTVKAYVLSGDVTSNQEADAKLNRKRTIA